LRPREPAKTLAHVIRGEIGQAVPMKPDHRLPDNLLVEAERGEPLSRIHEELSDSGVMLGLPARRRDFQRQKQRKPARCRRTVSG
jgi:hypothetical protein